MSETAIFIEKPGQPERGCGSSCARVLALSALAMLTAATVGGCASEPKPTAELVRASTLVSEAEKSEAQHFAAADLQRARDELNNAQTAESAGKNDSARRYAERAAADADLASARAASGKAQQSAEQLRHSLDTLREQIHQNAAPTGNPGPGTSSGPQDRP
ncbi:MAG TPA: DUF4398 domain-containing protein [Steroidobacteraceae bacterium]|nr:DUF4398 domain-containing protein [Steroidobacteraceae bacterium]